MLTRKQAGPKKLTQQSIKKLKRALFMNQRLSDSILKKQCVSTSQLLTELSRERNLMITVIDKLYDASDRLAEDS